MGIIDRCEFRGRDAGAAVVVCPRGLSDDELRLIGRVACQGAGQCTAWFWDDASLAPTAPPTVDRPMTAEQADAALAIYIAETTRLCRAALPEDEDCRQGGIELPLGQVMPWVACQQRHRQGW
ncbi:MAG: hypothetical protein U1E17_17550 [Geminicoccaceae bacterium]